MDKTALFYPLLRLTPSRGTGYKVEDAA